MKEDTFWDLIEKLDWSKEGVDELVNRPLVRALAKKKSVEIEGFFELLARAAYMLDTRAHWFAWGKWGNDYFLYQRLCVVANGYDFFAQVQRHPTAFDGSTNYESLLYVADEAYLKCTGNEFDRNSSVSVETGSNPAGWDRLDA